MAEIMRTEFVLQNEDGSVIDWFANIEEAKAAAAREESPCKIEQVDELYPEKRVVWASHRSMLEID